MMWRMETAEPTDESFRPNRVRLLRDYISQMSKAYSEDAPRNA